MKKLLSTLLCALLLAALLAGCAENKKEESALTAVSSAAQSSAPSETASSVDSSEGTSSEESASEETSSETETIDRGNLPILSYDILFDEDHLAPSIGRDKYLFDRQIKVDDSTLLTLEQSGYMEQEILCHLRVVISDEWLEQTFSEEDVQQRIDWMHALGITCEPHEEDIFVVYHGEFLYSDMERLAELGGYSFSFCACEKGEGSVNFE